MNPSVSTALVPINRCFTDKEEVALAGFLAGYKGSTRGRTHWTCDSSLAGAPTMSVASSTCTASPSSASGGIWRPDDGRERPSPAGCARSRASTATPRKKP
jgi:hypothetical protein